MAIGMPHLGSTAGLLYYYPGTYLDVVHSGMHKSLQFNFAVPA